MLLPIGLKEYEKAVKLSTVFIALTDSIYQREKTNAALELETLYDVDEREAHIAEQALKLKIRTISLAFIFFIVLLSCFFFGRFGCRIVISKKRTGHW